MFNGMGIQWAATLLGCVAFALVPIPVIFYIYGARIRQRSSFAPTGPPPSLATSMSAPRQPPIDDLSNGEKEQDLAMRANVPAKSNNKVMEAV